MVLSDICGRKFSCRQFSACNNAILWLFSLFSALFCSSSSQGFSRGKLNFLSTIMRCGTDFLFGIFKRYVLFRSQFYHSSFTCRLVTNSYEFSWQLFEPAKHIVRFSVQYCLFVFCVHTVANSWNFNHFRTASARFYRKHTLTQLFSNRNYLHVWQLFLP